MQTELKIKEILSGQVSVDKKVDDIRKFMNWDKKKLKSAIMQYGTTSKEGKDSIINVFWIKKA